MQYQHQQSSSGPTMLQVPHPYPTAWHPSVPRPPGSSQASPPSSFVGSTLQPMTQQYAPSPQPNNANMGQTARAPFAGSPAPFQPQPHQLAQHPAYLNSHAAPAQNTGATRYGEHASMQQQAVQPPNTNLMYQAPPLQQPPPQQQAQYPPYGGFNPGYQMAPPLASPLPVPMDVPVRLSARCPLCANLFAYESHSLDVLCPFCQQAIKLPPPPMQMQYPQMNQPVPPQAPVHIMAHQQVVPYGMQPGQMNGHIQSAYQPQVSNQPHVSDEYYYELLGKHMADLECENSALGWLARATPSRSCKLAVPRDYRVPKSIAGQGGYSVAFIELGLTLREADTSTGHWHAWYAHPQRVHIKSLQSAINRRYAETNRAQGKPSPQQPSPQQSTHGENTSHGDGRSSVGHPSSHSGSPMAQQTMLSGAAQMQTDTQAQQQQPQQQQPMQQPQMQQPMSYQPMQYQQQLQYQPSVPNPPVLNQVLSNHTSPAMIDTRTPQSTSAQVQMTGGSPSSQMDTRMGESPPQQQQQQPGHQHQQSKETEHSSPSLTEARQIQKGTSGDPIISADNTPLQRKRKADLSIDNLAAASRLDERELSTILAQQSDTKMEPSPRPISSFTTMRNGTTPSTATTAADGLTPASGSRSITTGSISTTTSLDALNAAVRASHSASPPASAQPQAENRSPPIEHKQLLTSSVGLPNGMPPRPIQQHLLSPSSLIQSQPISTSTPYPPAPNGSMLYPGAGQSGTVPYPPPAGHTISNGTASPSTGPSGGGLISPITHSIHPLSGGTGGSGILSPYGVMSPGSASGSIGVGSLTMLSPFRGFSNSSTAHPESGSSSILSPFTGYRSMSTSSPNNVLTSPHPPFYPHIPSLASPKFNTTMSSALQTSTQISPPPQQQPTTISPPQPNSTAPALPTDPIQLARLEAESRAKRLAMEYYQSVGTTAALSTTDSSAEPPGSRSGAVAPVGSVTTPLSSFSPTQQRPPLPIMEPAEKLASVVA